MTSQARRQRAFTRLARLYPDVFADLLALERAHEGLDPHPGRHKQVRPCGTPAAYKRHRDRGEKPCRACLDAHAAKSSANRARSKAGDR